MYDPQARIVGLGLFEGESFSTVVVQFMVRGYELHFAYVGGGQ